MARGKPPLEIDLIELLYGDGEVTLDRAHRQAGSAETLWPVLAKMFQARTAAVWVVEDAGARPLADWEVAQLVRARCHGSGEPSPPDEWLVLYPAERTKEAYDTDCARWYHQEFGDQE